MMVSPALLLVSCAILCGRLIPSAVVPSSCAHSRASLLSIVNLMTVPLLVLKTIPLSPPPR